MTTPMELRRRMIKMIAHANGGHIAPNLSVIEILHVLFFKILNVDPARPDWSGRDRFVMSKGHCAAALYTTMAARGFYTEDDLKPYNVEGQRVPPVVDQFGLPGIEASTGALGRGLSIGLGMALAAQRDGTGQRVYVLAGDGECQEGNVWEAAMLAPALGLDNLTLIVDYNGLQGSFVIDDVMELSNLADRFRNFGWQSHEVDGHDTDMLEKVLRVPPQDGPKAVIARTVKGKGLSMMENETRWHYRSLTLAELVKALRELV